MPSIDNIPKAFEPKEAEKRIYSEWMEKGYFHAVPDNEKKPYTIVIPPPNITGQLHMGHALDNTIQDVLIRWRRMQGYSALWMPGTDHASIATEAKIVEAMAKEGIIKDDIGREAFLERAWQWKEEYGGRIVEQLKRLGSSCDWERERFTLDEGLSKAVEEVFIRLYEKDLIYRGERIINWCPVCLTSISDAEVEYEEADGAFWHIRYPFENGTGGVVVATTRPETMLGDTAVAVNPGDDRYADLVGRNVVLPLTGRVIPVIADDYVDMDFGTGVVKITPAHDPNDFEIGLRHDLEILDVMTDDARMNNKTGKYAGMDRYAARKLIVSDLDEQGLLVKTEPHKHNVGQCYRCSTTVEPRVSLQWFVKMKPLAEPAIKAVREGETEFIPERFDKIYYNWMENIRDWCISRQLWWGHRIPAYYCHSCGKTIVASEMPDICPDCGSTRFSQDEGTLDTWFSSALWPFSTLGWPDKTDELDYFYPTSVLVTAYDIIFFWVARMIFSAIEHTGEVPFKYVFIHGIIRDEQGRKMSKSLNNGIDPLEIIETSGADALRYSLITGNSPGSDQRFLPMKVEAGRNFANKIWNAFRFFMMNAEGYEIPDEVAQKDLQPEDKWILTRMNDLIGEVTGNLERFELGVALAKLYNFIWEEYCDWYIEMVKSRLFDKSAPYRTEALYVLKYVLENAIKLLHPYMPFLTEELYSYLCEGKGSVMISIWPEVRKDYDFPDDVILVQTLMDATRKIRNIRSSMNVPPSRKVGAIIVSSDEQTLNTFRNGTAFVSRLANLDSIRIACNNEGIPDTAITEVIDKGELYIPLGDLIDIDKELERLKGEITRIDEEICRVENKLMNAEFTSKAPAKVVEKEQEKLRKFKEMKGSLTVRMELLSKV